MKKIRILLIDDHSLFRESLGRLLDSEPDMQVAGSYASMLEAQLSPGREPADIALLDFDLGDEMGLLRARKVLETGLARQVMLVTAGMSDSDTLRMLEIGVAGIFLKHSPPAQLLEAIRKAVQGEMWLHNQAVRALVASVTTPRKERRAMLPLSERDRNVLSALVEGLTNKEIAAKLEISENAVKWALQQLFEKTGARVRSQLVRIVLERYGKDGLKNESAGGTAQAAGPEPK
jgi:DNA-binding NarL/FixJ family response regulator